MVHDHHTVSTYYICSKKTRWRYFRTCTINPPDFLKCSSFVTLITVKLKSAAVPHAGPLLLLPPSSGARQRLRSSPRREWCQFWLFFWPSLLCLCWSFSYSLSSATVGPFGICAGLVLLGEPDQSWSNVVYIWMCSTYMLKPLCPFFWPRLCQFISKYSCSPI